MSSLFLRVSNLFLHRSNLPMFLSSPPQSDEYKDLADAMSKTAADFKGQILFIFMDADKEDNTRYVRV